MLIWPFLGHFWAIFDQKIIILVTASHFYFLDPQKWVPQNFALFKNFKGGYQDYKNYAQKEEAR